MDSFITKYSTSIGAVATLLVKYTTVEELVSALFTKM